MTPLQLFTWICVGLTTAILVIGWLYAAARMVSYGWRRGHWRAEQDNKREESEAEQDNKHEESEKET